MAPDRTPPESSSTPRVVVRVEECTIDVAERAFLLRGYAQSGKPIALMVPWSAFGRVNDPPTASQWQALETIARSLRGRRLSVEQEPGPPV